MLRVGHAALCENRRYDEAIDQVFEVQEGTWSRGHKPACLRDFFIQGPSAIASTTAPTMK